MLVASPVPLQTIRHRNGTVQRIYDGWLETDIPGLPTLMACSRDDQAETARSLGYGDNIDLMNREHDQLHAMLADWLGLSASYSLTVAAGGEVEPGLAEAEEAAVMAVQRFMRMADRALF